ncbi:EAL domain-containing protein [Jannaschia sp. R86511]|uniref:EAL domain-containing protein n=1 Tax=Jannaschia sp. R86511 TaxID=3093853 RepID=UPI0036D3080A
MTKDCASCTCSTAPSTPGAGRVLLATHVDHTATALRSLALRAGTPAQVLAPGLLELTGVDVAAFVASARDELSSVEADEVRCLVLPEGTQEPAAADLLGAALGAPTLAAAGARVDHASLLPLFADEQACFHAVYQPIVDLADRRTIGHESLLRAVTPDGSPVFPDQLFPAAEAAGWTNLLDRVGRTTALRDAGPWLGDDLLFINFVPTSIYRPEVCLRTTEQAARAAGVRLDRIVFEVTEGHRVHDLDHLEHVFAYYRSRDCKVALDDLGAGYSSLNTVVRLRPDVVKLDKDIVQELPGRVAASVVEAIVGIVHSYGGLVLAECVETAEQAAAALELGVDLGQGWFFGRPERPGCARVADPTASPVTTTARATTGGGLRRARGAEVPLLPPSAGLPADLLTRALDGAVGGVSVVDVVDPAMPVVYVNPALTRLTGYAAEELLGANMRMLQGPATDRDAVAGLSRAVREGREHRAVLRNYRKDGSLWWNELHLSPVLGPDGTAGHYLGYQLDVTARLDAERELARQVGRDALTGLANRSALFHGLEQAVARAQGADRSVAVVFLDLDGFKDVNDTFGHAAGDAVLAQVGDRLEAVLRRGDLLARIGGDEFVAVLADLEPGRAQRVAARVAGGFVDALGEPLVAGPVEVRLSGSVGVALTPQHALSADRLLAEADAAMYRAKRDGAGQVRTATGSTPGR